MAEKQWTGQWISDSTYKTPKNEDPAPMLFRRKFVLSKDAEDIAIDITAMGIFIATIDGRRLGEDWFAPGFTDYKYHLQYMTYHTGALMAGEHTFTVTIGGGWAVGRSTNVQNTNQSVFCLEADRQALLCDLTIAYSDGTSAVIGSDEQFEVTEQGPCRFASFYDGETYDARVIGSQIAFRHAVPEKLRHQPKILREYGTCARVIQKFDPAAWSTSESGRLICDFGQNIAGVVTLRVNAKAGQKIVIRHAEALQMSGELYVQNLRSAKQTLTYICRDGEQAFTPHLTFMGFRYIEIDGIGKENIEVRAIALTSATKQIGDFSCSNEDLNQLQQNILWSARDNFVDIPTDCPQRDERQGWTGDIALFARTACFNFEMKDFFTKWLRDMKAEQGPLGSIPIVVPKRRGVTISVTTAAWGDSCIYVPWEVYMNSGDTELLREMYPMMKKFIADAARSAALTTVKYHTPYIFQLPFQFGDWCAPYGNIKDWLAKGPWTGTAYYCHSCEIMSKIAAILGETEESREFDERADKIAHAYMDVFTDGAGKLKEEFQSGYVLPLYFGLCDRVDASGGLAKTMAANLARLIDEQDGAIMTGFTATPYILFALADYGQADAAYRLLLRRKAPSWLYQITKGATTIWEQFDVIEEDGKIKEASMNHYAYGSVGDFFYRRICGLEALEPCYKKFRVNPVIGGGITEAHCSHLTPYGEIRVEWHLEDGEMKLDVDAPEGTTWVH